MKIIFLFFLVTFVHFNELSALNKIEIKQSFSNDVEDALNAQINMELKAFYIYETMAAFFQRPEVGLEGFEKFFRKSSNEELGHARKMIKYLNKRGGTYVPNAITLSKTYWKNSWFGAFDAVKDAFDKEKDVNQKLIELHILAGNKKDPNAQDFMDEFLKEEVDSIALLRVLISRFERMKSTDMAEFLIDQELKN